MSVELAPIHYAVTTKLVSTIARYSLDFCRLILDFAMAPELCQSTNKHAGAISVGAPAHCLKPKKNHTRLLSRIS